MRDAVLGGGSGDDDGWAAGGRRSAAGENRTRRIYWSGRNGFAGVWRWVKCFRCGRKEIVVGGNGVGVAEERRRLVAAIAAAEGATGGRLRAVARQAGAGEGSDFIAHEELPFRIRI